MLCVGSVRGDTTRQCVTVSRSCVGVETADPDTEAFLGALGEESDSLYIDSGAEVTVISESVWRSLGSTTPFLISTSTRKIHLCLRVLLGLFK